MESKTSLVCPECGNGDFFTDAVVEVECRLHRDETADDGVGVKSLEQLGNPGRLDEPIICRGEACDAELEFSDLVEQEAAD